MKLKDEIEYIEKRRRGLKKYQFFLEDLQEKNIEDLKLPLTVYDTFVVIRIKDFKELKKAREFLKSYFGSWQDEIRSIDSPYGNTAMIRYERKYKKDEEHEKIRHIQIWYETTIDKIPDEVKANSDCKFVKQTRTEMVYVCPTKEENNGTIHD